MTTQFAVYTSTQTITAPSNMVPGTLDAYLTGPGGNGGLSAHGTRSGAGGGGAGFSGEAPWAGITAGSTSIALTLPAGGAATAATIVASGAATITASPGTNASGATAGTGGAASGNSIAKAGGNGAIGINGATTNGAGGGGSGGSTGAGGAGSTSTGGSAGTGGTDGGQSLAGTAGASGAGTSSPGANGLGPGSGASGGGSVGALNNAGGTGGGSQALFVWTVLTESLAVPAAMSFVMATAKKAVSGFKLYSSFTFAPLPVSAVNQWSATFSQPASFQNTPPALQSAVIALTPGNSVGGGSGTPSAGNWLFCLTGMTEQSPAAAFTAGDSDDIHSFWRPGDVTTSQWAVSTAAAKTRTSVWYTANLARTAADVYAAPNGAMAGMACLVIEVAGIGPWDTVTGITTGYAAAATSLNLAMSAPSAASCVIAAFCGDSTAATQAFAPGNPWQVLSTVSATNGSDHTCDAVLNSALLGTTSSSVSVTATAGSATDLSGVLIAVQINAASPISGGANAAWPGRFIIEAAFGSGFQTPADQMTWTTLNDNGVAAAQAVKRGWSWRDSGGIPYALGQLQSGEGAVQLDNADGHLTPSNAASPYYPDVVTGTPIRLRCALGTITDRQAGNVTVNRWYTVSRNILDIPEKRNDAWRNFVEMSLTDIWSVVAASCPSPYRGEVEQDSPGWWWPMDDQPGTGGVLPTSLRNAAKGSTTPLNIVLSPNGGQIQAAYLVNGSQAVVSSSLPGSIATYSVAAEQGWMYGDPQSGQQSAQSGNPVTASPGSAAWQQAGGAGNTGSYGWFLSATDTFPSLAGPGATIEKWFKYPFAGTGTVANPALGGSSASVSSQPYCPLTILELATGSNPVAILQLDTSGHLSLITYAGATPASHSIWSGSDLRSNTWHQVVAVLTSTTWLVYLDGGLLATVSGPAAGMSDFTWIAGNGDFGSNGGSSAGTGLVHGGNVSLSHLAVYSGLLPAWRVRAHYCAAVMGFGALPAPTSPAVQWITSGCTPDGSQTWTGAGGYLTVAGSESMSAVAVAVAGTITSGPSAWAAGNGFGTHMFAWVGFSGLAPEFNIYMNSSLGSEAESSVAAGGGDAYTAGFGGGATGAGFCHVSGGSGASPPTSGTSTGDTVAQRLERVLGYGGITAPNRSVDSSASALVQAAIDVGGAAAGSGMQNIQQSDDGLMFVDSGGALSYRSRSHLNSDTVVWNLSSAGPAYGYPYQPSQQFVSDPQRVYNAITISPYSPDGSTLPVVTPTNASAVATSQAQYGPRPLALTSYLQSSAEQLSQANGLFTSYGQIERRVPVLTVDAAGYPPAWLLVLGANVGDLVQVTDQPMLGGPLSVGTYRISSLSRQIAFGANGNRPVASITIVADPDIIWWT